MEKNEREIDRTNPYRGFGIPKRRKREKEREREEDREKEKGDEPITKDSAERRLRERIRTAEKLTYSRRIRTSWGEVKGR